MLPVWLVLISLSNPLAPPQIVRGYPTVEECYDPANSGDNVSVMPLYKRTPPKGHVYACLKLVYPT